MKTILICIILMAVLALAALFGATHAKPHHISADYFVRVAQQGENYGR